MPEISRFYGIIILMFADDHNPPHFHVRYGDKRAVISVKNGVVTGQMARKELVKVFDGWICIKMKFWKTGTG